MKKYYDFDDLENFMQVTHDYGACMDLTCSYNVPDTEKIKLLEIYKNERTKIILGWFFGNHKREFWKYGKQKKAC